MSSVHTIQPTLEPTVSLPENTVTIERGRSVINLSNHRALSSSYSHGESGIAEDSEIIELVNLEKSDSCVERVLTVNRSEPSSSDQQTDLPNATHQDSIHLPQRVHVKTSFRDRMRVASAALTILVIGCNDGVVGAILPYIESHYGLSYGAVSTLWLANSIGFIIIGVLSQFIYTRIGRNVMISGGPLLLVIMYAMIIPSPPFPVVAVAFFVGGLGMALIIGQVNVYLSHLEPMEILFGIVHGSYGIGATISPLVATALISKGVYWSNFYAILLGLNVLTAAFSSWAFFGCDRDLGNLHMLHKYKKLQRSGVTEEAGEEAIPATASIIENSVYHDALRSKVTIVMAVFYLFYQGAEVALGGWIVSFMIDIRGGDPNKVGYVSAGFWAGITLGRFILNQFLSRLMPIQFVVYILLLVIIAFELMTWLIPNVIGSAVAISIAGFFIGPVFPTVITYVSGNLPRKIQQFSLTLASAFGSSGAALWPFITGMLAQSKGVYVVHPIAISLFASLCFLWWLIATPQRKLE
ncbi:major facilitator superfamily domain-containing protein [Lipomyces oligophaga]|uniref:major facilitator superfamily domain-containing protein n=1 Tax=Lipomyces oligophaga TaxID=45792 RepID=UPI0034CEA992